MRKLIASTFTSLDGVMQAPGGPSEDPTGNFTLGGWLFAFGDDEGMDLSAAGFDGKDRELVLGRKTYDIFEAYWPYNVWTYPVILGHGKRYECRYAAAIRNICKAASAEPRAPAMSR
jgi:dihydrofolate reductase